MHPPARSGLAAIAAGLVLATGAISPAVAQTAPADPSESAVPAAAGSADLTVTLVTGDVVHVTSPGTDHETITVDAVSGTPDSIQTMQIGDDTYVLPDVATPYVTSGALDEELFNVSNLIDYGYDDQSSGGIPVIAQYDSGLRAQPKALPGSAKVRTLTSVGGAALKTDHQKSSAFWTALTAAGKTRSTPGDLGGVIDRLWLDGRVTPTLDVSVPLVGAPDAWAAGFDGTGATVAVLDTGIDAQHPDVDDALRTSVSFVPGEEVTDRDGHGTHVASTIVGSGEASDGTHVGVAPGADLVVGKVLADEGYGQDSWIIAGMEWAATEADADVVNMSLGDDERTDAENILSISLDALSKTHDTLFVVAAGNSGGVGTIGAPGTAESALTVAATDDADGLAPFSSRGPRGLDDGLKPDLAAPGVGITAARSQYSSGSGALSTLSGTSMATPHVAGAAAILAAQHPDWSAVHLKDALMSSTVELDYSPYEVGSGRLDIPAAMDAIDATGSVYFGKALWGEADPKPATRSIVYRNTSDAAVELTLSGSTTGPDGDVDLVQLSAQTVTVPADGEVSIEATASFADARTVGHYLGQVVATTADGTVVARTTTGLTREDERYDLDVTVLGTKGQPIEAQVTKYRYGSTAFTGGLSDPETGAVKTERVAPGVYAAWVKIRLGSTDGTDRTYWINQPHIVVDKNTEVVLDLREATPVRLETPRPSDPFYQRVEWWHDAGLDIGLDTFYSALPAGPATEVWVNPLQKVAGDGFNVTARWARTQPLLDLSVRRADDTVDAVPLAPLYQSGSRRLDGKVDLPVVVAGTGTPEEIAAVDAEGKALIVTQDVSVSQIERSAAAAEAGAELLVVINDGAGTLYDIAAGTVPVIAVSAEEGEHLLADPAATRITGKAIALPAYEYDYAHTWQGTVPTDLTLKPGKGDVVAVTDRFADPTPRTVQVTRYDCPSYLTRCLGSTRLWESGTDHVTYLSPGQEGIEAPWVADVSVPSVGLDLRDVKRSHAAGSEIVLDWFGVQAPRQGDGFWRSEHRKERIRVNMPLASTTDGITATWGRTATVSSKLYQGDTLLASSSSQSVTGTATGAGHQQYRLETSVTVPQETWSTSNRTTSTWVFGMDAAETGNLPLIGLTYDVPVDGDRAVSANGWTELSVIAAHDPGALRAGEVTELSLELSYDEGKTWQAVEVTHDGDRWDARVKLPKGTDAVSLRTSAKDDAGNSVTQEVNRAFDVR